MVMISVAKPEGQALAPCSTPYLCAFSAASELPLSPKLPMHSLE